MSVIVLINGVPDEEGPYRVQFGTEFIRVYGQRDNNDVEWTWTKEHWASRPDIVPGMLGAVMSALLDPERFGRKVDGDWAAYQTKGRTREEM